MSKITMTSVAQLAGVSAATVSRTLSGRGPVSKEVRERVIEVADKIGYHRNLSAMSLRTARTNYWIVIVPDIANPFFTDLSRGIEDVASTKGSMTFIANTDDNREKEKRYYDMAIEAQVCGAIIVPSSASTDVSELLCSDIPVIIIDQMIAQTVNASILSDNIGGGVLAGKRLYACGYQRVAAVVGPNKDYGWQDRLRGLKKSLAGTSTQVICVKEADNRVAGGEKAMDEIIKSERVDAVFSSNNLMALGILRSLRKHGLKVPQDVGVIGFDLSNILTIDAPAITTVNQNPYQIGAAAGHMLVDIQAGTVSMGTVIRYPTELELGETTSVQLL